MASPNDLVTISDLIARLETIKKEKGDLVVCLTDEDCGMFVPLLKSCIDSSVVCYNKGKEIEPGLYETTMKKDGEDQVVVIQWSA